MPIANVLVPGLLWVWLFWHLHYEWTLNEQYNYGWAVPFLAAFMFYLRWQSRPSPRETQASRLSALALATLLALLLPLRVIEEANPDWRLLSWVLALVVGAFWLLLLERAGGRRWVWHFAFPVCFSLVAVPWPAQFENGIIQALTRAVAFAAVEIAGWIGIGAYQLGNIIELHNGFVGVDEACSGVKTLQASLMVSLVLGELFQLRLAKRLGLLVAGCVWVFICNVLRATTLLAITAKHGSETLARWHDPVGTAVLLLGMGGLMVFAWLLREREAAVSRTGSETQGNAAEFPVGLGWKGTVAALGWLGFAFAVSEGWYRAHERKLVALPPWQVQWPSDVESVRNIAIPESTRTILRYDDASSAAWENPPAVRWWGFFARWEPQRTALQLVRSHSPEICLPAVGRTFVREGAEVVFETPALPLRFRVYEFQQNQRPLFVYVSIQEDKVTVAADAAASAEWSARGRLLAAWRGQRNLGQRLLELAVIGYDDASAAHAAVTETVREIVAAARTTD